MAESRRRGQRQPFGPGQGIWLRLGLATCLWWPVSVVLLSQWGQWPGFGWPGDEVDRFGFVLDRSMARGAGILLALSVGLVAVGRASSSGDRRQTLRAALAPMLAVGAWLAIAPLTHWCDTQAEWRLVRHSAPLVAALDRYTADHGHAPPTLASLVPDYLPAVPRTGWPGCPEYDYRAYGEGVTWRGADGRGFTGAFDSPDPDERYHGPGPYRDLSRAEITARLGRPSATKPLCYWRLAVHLRDHLLDEDWFVARYPPWRATPIYGRWCYEEW